MRYRINLKRRLKKENQALLELRIGQNTVDQCEIAVFWSRVAAFDAHLASRPKEASCVLWVVEA